MALNTSELTPLPGAHITIFAHDSARLLAAQLEIKIHRKRESQKVLSVQADMSDPDAVWVLFF